MSRSDMHKAATTTCLCWCIGLVAVVMAWDTDWGWSGALIGAGLSMFSLAGLCFVAALVALAKGRIFWGAWIILITASFLGCVFLWGGWRRKQLAEAKENTSQVHPAGILPETTIQIERMHNPQQMEIVTNSNSVQVPVAVPTNFHYGQFSHIYHGQPVTHLTVSTASHHSQPLHLPQQMPSV
eukprot:TRINITY_DN12710_c0_g1_i1.p1 TRINITY_DN12710_c0_g1~~TRINITY_DN12710_c0_g1_i1.p1  ORF type:complete len:183 (-),score=19.72 TRINITY_DN12710_c0_g1_i1:92-640(-)